MRWLKLPWLNTLAVYILLVLSFLTYGRYFFYRDPGSIFYDEAHAFERQYSDYREHEVKNFIHRVERANFTNGTYAGAEPSLYVAFSSVKRDGEQYLPLSVASTVYPLSKCERQDIYFEILIAHTNATEHPSWHTSWLRSVTDRFDNYLNLSKTQVAKLTELEQTNAFSEKGIFDYVYVLQRCLDSGAPYCLVLEDDIILADGWLAHTLNGLMHISKTVSDREWLFMRLFNQERSTGWSSREIGQNHELLISLAIAGPVLLLLLFARSRSSLFRLDIASISIICVLLIPTLVVLFYQAGKASLLPPRDGVVREPFGCCSQALVFPRDRISRIITFLTEKGSGQIDLLLNELARDNDLDRWALYPVQLQHVGQRSARNTSQKEAQAVWSMAFESQDPQHLSRTHQNLLDYIYPDGCNATVDYVK